MFNYKEIANKMKIVVQGLEMRPLIAEATECIGEMAENIDNNQKKLGEQFKNLVINEGNSNAEVAVARGSHDWLPDRLDNMDNKVKIVESTQVSKKELDATNKRIDNLVLNSSSSEGNAELLDIRIDKDGYKNTSAGETVRNLSRAVTTFKYMKECSYILSSDDIKNTGEVISPFQNNYIINVNHNSLPNYSYCKVVFDGTTKDIREKNGRYGILLKSVNDVTVRICLSQSGDWSKGTFINKDIKLKANIETFYEIDMQDENLLQYLNSTDSGYLNILLLLHGNGLTSKTGEYSIGFHLVNLSDLLNPVSLSELSLRALNSDSSNYAKNAGGGFIGDNISKMINSLIITQENMTYSLEKHIGANVYNPFWCFYLKVDYENLEDLNKNLFLNYKYISGIEATNTCIVLEPTDWNPNNKPVYFNIYKPVNIYEKIMGKSQDFIDIYSQRKYLYILIGYYCGTTDIATSSSSKATISPFLEDKESIVIANGVTNDLKNEILNSNMENIQKNINKISIGVVKYPINNYTVRLNTNNLTVLSKNGKWINCKKESEEVGTNYAGVYIRIDYNNIEELDGELLVNYRINQGEGLTQTCILYDMTDWGSGSSQGYIYLPTNQPFNLKERLLNSGLNYESKDHLFLCLVHYNPTGVSFKYDYDFQTLFAPTDSEDVYATAFTTDLMENLRNEFESKNKSGEYITCWGDSLTAGGGWTYQLQNLTGLTVYNGGTGGENSRTIMARQGADIMLVNNITIPSTTDPVIIASRNIDGGITTYLGNKVTPLLQGGAHVNPCYIGDIKGTLKWTGSDYADTSGTWTFTRTEVGEEVIINRPTAIRTDFDINKNNPKIMILFIGQNGGWNNLDDLINQHRLMIEHSRCEDFIVLGLSSGTASDRKEYEDGMKKEFGRRFISLREYLSQYGLEDANIEPTEQDMLMMEQGQTPQSLLTDSVHYNSACKTVIGNMIYKRIKELNII